MFLTQKSENNLIDFLASFSVLAVCATPAQMDLILNDLPTRCLNAANRFLEKQSSFSNHLNKFNTKPEPKPK